MSFARLVVVLALIVSVGVLGPSFETEMSPLSPVRIAAAEDCVVVGSGGNVTLHPPGCVP